MPNHDDSRCTSRLVNSGARALLFGVFCLGIAPSAFGNDLPDAWKLLPKSSIAYGYLQSPREIVDYVLQHPLRARIEKLPGIQDALKSEDYKKFQGGLAVVQSQTGKPWNETLQAILGNGVHVAFDPSTEGLAIVAQVADKPFAMQTMQQLIGWAKFANKNSLRTITHRDTTLHQGTDDGVFTLFQDWLIVSNKPALAKSIIDRAMDGGDSLLDHKQLAKSWPASSASRRAWIFADLKTLRDAKVADQLFVGQAEDPGAEILIGGILAALKHTGHATAELMAKDNHLRLRFEVPFDSGWTDGPREHYLGAGAKGVAVEHVTVPGQLFSLAAYRDLASMWLQADDLFKPAMVDSLAEVDSQLSIFFGGRDFGEDILGSLQPQVQLVVARQSFDQLPRPAIKLPSFALVGKLRETEKMTRDLRRTFQSFIGFINVVGAMEGNPQFDQDQEMIGASKLYKAIYVPEPSEENSKAARIHFNFSPTIGFHKDTVVFSSSTDLARQVVKAAAARKPEPRKDNTHMRLAAPMLQQVLTDNKGQLIAQNMLEKGNGKQAAEQEIHVLLEAASLVKTLAASLRNTAPNGQGQLQLDVLAELSP